jgi:hypothetical protein
VNCTICGQRSFAKLRLEIALGIATYLVCLKPSCIIEASERAKRNLLRAAIKLKTKQDAAEVIVAPSRPLDP